MGARDCYRRLSTAAGSVVEFCTVCAAAVAVAHVVMLVVDSAAPTRAELVDALTADPAPVVVRWADARAGGAPAEPATLPAASALPASGLVDERTDERMQLRRLELSIRVARAELARASAAPRGVAPENAAPIQARLDSLVALHGRIETGDEHAEYDTRNR